MARSSSLSGLLEPIPRSKGLSGRWSRADPMVALESFAVPSSPKWQTSGLGVLFSFNTSYQSGDSLRVASGMGIFKLGVIRSWKRMTTLVTGD